LLLLFRFAFCGLRVEFCAPLMLRASKPGALAHFSARIAAGHHRSALFCFKVGAVVLPNRAA
jgi:hypothetical protein